MENSMNTKNPAEKVIAKLHVWEENPEYHSGFGTSQVLGHFTVNMRKYHRTPEKRMVTTESLPEFPNVVTNFKELVGSELPDGTDQANHKEHAKERQRQFFKWVEEKYNLSEEENPDQPDIICSGGLLRALLAAPLKVKDRWDFQATKIGNSVLLWFEPKEDDGHRDNSLPGILFEALVTGADTGTNLWDLCYIKDWIIHRKSFGDLKILLVSDVDAVDQDGSWVEIKLFEKRQLDFLRRSQNGRTDKLKNVWSQLVVNDAKKLLYGVRDNLFLTNIEILSLDEFETMLNIHQEDKNSCYIFLSRILNFVRNQLSMRENQNQILEFQCSSTPVSFKNNPRAMQMVQNELRSRKVECLKVTSTPEWFKEHRKIFGLDENN